MRPAMRMLAIVSMLFLVTACEKKTDAPPSPPPAVGSSKGPPANAKESTPLTADALAQEVRSDFHATLTKYRDRVLEVSGPIAKGEPSSPGVPTLHLRSKLRTGTGAYVMLRCEFANDKAASIANLAANQEVKVRGKLKATNPDIILSDCELVAGKP